MNELKYMVVCHALARQLTTASTIREYTLGLAPFGGIALYIRSEILNMGGCLHTSRTYEEMFHYLTDLLIESIEDPE